MVNNTMQVDSTTGKRKINKPLIEKKRRARINNCLSQLKKLVLEATGRNSESAINSKLEKADILEMTVQYLERIKRGQHQNRTATTSTVMTPYQTGYKLCTSQAVRYLELNSQIQENEQRNLQMGNYQNNICSGAASEQYGDSIQCRLSGHLNNSLHYRVASNRNHYTYPTDNGVSSQYLAPISPVTATHEFKEKGQIRESDRFVKHNGEQEISNLRSRSAPVQPSSNCIAALNTNDSSDEQSNDGLNVNVQINTDVWRPW